ncbi:lytic transglycosylase domain-containing protein [Clostridium hydrogenum]|uniref:lytic transglycosylase domain-containing protein n=1 Tax=Clostridium hydrogenum TaxID=2855764 RepID=UPI001F266060|nr:lytic transglycosylase domain-containing protein [Clostridium hydrogenum]
MKSKIIKIIIVLFIIILVLNAKSIIKLFYPMKYSAYIYKYSAENNLDPYMVASVIRTESNFNIKAKSNKDAYGLMQMTPDTGEWVAQKMGIKNFKLDDLYNPECNIKMGCWYLRNLADEFNNDPKLYLAAYNGGRGNVQKWLNDKNHSKDGKNLHYIPYKETDRYVKKVMVDFDVYKKLYGK